MARALVTEPWQLPEYRGVGRRDCRTGELAHLGSPKDIDVIGRT